MITAVILLALQCHYYLPTNIASDFFMSFILPECKMTSRHRRQGIHSSILGFILQGVLQDTLSFHCTELNMYYGYYGYPDGWHITSDLSVIFYEK
jgi:hypothetical protein